MTTKQPLVGVIMGSKSDLPVLEPGLELFESWGVPYQVLVASAHRTPEQVSDWVTSAPSRGIQVIIAAAGGAAHLPGVVAAQTLLPVIGVPIDAGALRGTDSLYSIVQMPPGIPVATVGINAGVNAALLALHILARIDRRWESTLKGYRSNWQSKVDEQNAAIRGERPNAIPWLRGAQRQEEQPADIAPVEARRPAVAPASAPAAEVKSIFREAAPAAPASAPHTAKPGLRRDPQCVGRVRVDADLLAIDVAENATDCMLDGGIVAMPTDTVYGLAVDATNPEAVRALFQLKGRDESKPIAVFIESQRQLNALVRNLSGEVKQMLEAFWPGPLTVVFERRGGDFEYLTSGNTLGVRLPNHSIALALLQELRRPIACTSANPSGAPPARSADEVEQYFGRGVHMILDAGKLPNAMPSTVIDVTSVPYRLLREGSITRSQLASVLGDLIESDDTP